MSATEKSTEKTPEPVQQLHKFVIKAPKRDLSIKGNDSNKDNQENRRDWLAGNCRRKKTDIDEKFGTELKVLLQDRDGFTVEFKTPKGIKPEDLVRNVVLHKTKWSYEIVSQTAYPIAEEKPQEKPKPVPPPDPTWTLLSEYTSLGTPADIKRRLEESEDTALVWGKANEVLTQRVDEVTANLRKQTKAKETVDTEYKEREKSSTEKFEKEKGALKDKIKNLESALASKGPQIISLPDSWIDRFELEQLTTDYTDLKKEYTTKEAELKTVQKKLRDSEDLRSNQDDLVKKLSDLYSDLVRKLAKQGVRISEVDKDGFGHPFGGDIKKLIEESKQNIERTEQHQKQITQANQELAKVKHEKIELSREYDVSVAKIDKKNKKQVEALKNLAQEIRRKSQSEKELYVFVEEREKEVAALNAKLSELKQKAESFGKDLEAYKKENPKIIDERDKYLAELIKTKEENAVLASNKNADSLTFEELVVAQIRLLGKETYSGAAVKYSEAFPDGISLDVKLALTGDKLSFVLNKEVIDACIEAGVSTNKSLDEILAESEDRTRPFDKTDYNAENFFEYFGARSLIALRPAEEEMKAKLEEAREVKKEYEEQERLWNTKKGLAKKAQDLVKGRSDLYDELKKQNTDRIKADIPLFIYSHEKEGEKVIYFVLPTDKKTEEHDLTNLLWANITESIRDSMSITQEFLFKDEMDISLLNVLDSKVIRLKIPLKNLTEEQLKELETPNVVSSLGKNYENSYANQLGIKLKTYNLGETKK